MTKTTGLAREGYGRCPICGEDQWDFVREGIDLCQSGSSKHFFLSRCISCGHIMQTPLPSDAELQTAYSTNYAPYRPAWKESGWPFWKVLRQITTWRRLLRLRRYGKGHKLLEVGSGAGDFLYAAHRAGWNVRAVEYNKRLVDILRTDLGLDVRAGQLEPGLWEDGEFDVIIAWSVLEHVRDPMNMLVTASLYLRPRGLLFLQIPTLYGIERGRWFGQYWALLDFPRHLNFFGKESLTRLCDRAGMDLIVFKTPMLEAIWCYFASSCSYILYAESRGQAFMRSLRVAVRAAFALPDLVFKAWCAHGTEAFAVAVKRQR